jgi:hypothetical protein
MGKVVKILCAVIACAAMFLGCSSSGSSKPGASPSDTPRCEAPVFSVNPGTYNTDQIVSITCATSGAAVHYTTDGSDPVASSAIYTSPISVSGDDASLTIKAAAIQSGMLTSAVTSGTFVISYDTCAAPSMSPSASTYNSGQMVTLTSNTSGAAIYYTTDGTTPTTSSAKYSEAIAVSGNTIITIQAIAVKSGMKKSSVSSGTYTISYATCAAPVFDLAGGTYNTAQTTRITCATNGATIYYTTDGSVPETTSSNKYDSSSTLTIAGEGSSTIKAIAVKSGMNPSVIAAVTYTISYGKCATPEFNIAAGTYNSDLSVTITCATSGVSIYYTTDGTTPSSVSTNSAKYTEAISVTEGTKTIKAIAVKSEMKTSETASAMYIINYTACAAPVFSPAAGTYNSDQTVTISTTTSGATIYYTINGDTPTSSSTKYTGPISVSGDETITTVQAIAVKSGMRTSAVSSAEYTISYDYCGTPTFSLASGTYNSDQSVILTCATEGATIYYTMDGAAPTISTSSSCASGTAISVSGDGTVKKISAIAVKFWMKDSALASAAYTISYNTCAAPVFSVTAGTYNADQSIELSCVTSGATIYYTTNGTTPSTSSAKYAGIPISIAGNGTSVTINAIAVAPMMKTSAMSSASYAITYDICAAPVFSPAAGTYNSDQTVTISTTTSGATIYYTIDGKAPTSSSTKYTGPISVSGDETITGIKAVAIKSGMQDSAVSGATYTISYDYCGTPVFNIAAGSYNSDQSVTISSATEGATIYYTTDGSTPSATSAVYSGAIAVAGDYTSMTISAIAVKSGMKNSAVAVAAYAITYTTCAAPVISPDGGTYNSDQTISISTTTTGAAIYYTTDGSAPTTSSTKYTGTFPVSGDGTSMSIKAIAVSSGMRNSAVAYSSFAISYSQCSAPEFSPEGGTFNTSQTVTISTNTTGSAIYYTTDGSTPTTSSTKYTGPITVSGNGTSMTIKAFAYLSGMTKSSVVSQAYVINMGSCTVPVLSPHGGFYAATQNVTLSCTTSGATIYYTTDGSAPTTSSNVYSGAITVTGNGATTLKAVAVHSGMTDSSFVSGVYTVISTPLNVSGTVTTLLSGMASPQGVATDGANLYIADSHDTVVRKYVIATGTLSVLAGKSGSQGTADGTGTAATFYFPWGIATDGLNVYVTDATAHTIRQIDISTGVVTTVAGSAGTSGTTDAIGTSARFNTPCGLATDGVNLYIADQQNHSIRKMSLSTKSVSTLAGISGTSGFLDAIGTNAKFNQPSNLTTDGENLYIADAMNYRIRTVVLSTGAVTTLAGSGTSAYVNGTGTAASFIKPFGIYTDATNIYVSDYTDHTVRKISLSTKVVSLIAGTSRTSGSTDGTGSSALFNCPASLTTDGINLFVSDHFNGKIRQIAGVANVTN